MCCMRRLIFRRRAAPEHVPAIASHQCTVKVRLPGCSPLFFRVIMRCLLQCEFNVHVVRARHTLCGPHACMSGHACLIAALW